MKTLLAIVLLIGGFLFYRLKFSGGGEDLQGRWTIVSAPEGWKVVPGMDIMVTTDEIQIRLGTVVTSKMHYVLGSEPDAIDATAPDGGLHQGRYRLEGDILTLSVGSVGKPRPENVGSAADGAMKWVLRRGAHL